MNKKAEYTMCEDDWEYALNNIPHLKSKAEKELKKLKKIEIEINKKFPYKEKTIEEKERNKELIEALKRNFNN